MSTEIEQRMHDLLVERAARWLTAKGHAVVITDMSHGQSETADAIGWKGRVSTLIECKATRADFLADRHKFFRREPQRGMAGYRYYLAPPDVVAVDDLPPAWGLLVFRDGKTRLVREAQHQPHDTSVEVSLLLSAIRRIGHAAPTGISCKFYTIESKNRATLGVEIEDPQP